jgi:hypothetical protein
MDFSWIGVWLLVIGAVLIVFESILAGLWTVRIATRSRALSLRLMTEQSRLQADVERLRAARAETRLLWQPYRRILRWLRHPLVTALLQSLALRRVRAR